MSPLGHRNYIVLFGLLGLVVFLGLLIPLMDNDAAHHANIALRMYLTGDYVNLIDNGKDYLDKPHLHFWLAAISYHVFGVTAFAYKFPSFIFSIVGLFSVYKLGSRLFNQETGRLAALILATAFAFFISLGDVRMDAILVAAICFSCWQLIELVYNSSWGNLVGAALGLAIGFSVKGLVGAVVPLLFLGWYLLERRQWGLVWRYKFLFVIILFFGLIGPVLYCYYLQFDLHPEKIIRGKDHISGLQFALFGGGAERFAGGMSQDGKRDWFFFFYTFLWAFAPWSILTYMAMVRSVREKRSWYLSTTILTLAIVIGLAGSKLPHYLNIAFPFAALLTAVLLSERPLSKTIGVIIYSMLAILLVSNLLVNGWLFPEKNYRLLVFGFVILLGDSILSRKTASDTKPFTYLIRACIFLYLFLNINFYPRLLNYQGGQELAEKIKGTVPLENVYFWKNNYSSSFCFSTKTLRKELTDTTSFKKIEGSHYVVYDSVYEKEITDHGWVLGEKISVPDFEITKLDKEFANPGTRDQHCSKLVIARLLFFIQP